MEGPRISLEGLVRLLLSTKDGKSAVFYAVVNTNVVGCIHVEQVEDKAAEFGLFAVDPELQSSGIGRSEPSFDCRRDEMGDAVAIQEASRHCRDACREGMGYKEGKNEDDLLS
jgi:hypothetical protein